MRRLRIVLALGAGLVVAGCSGGGGGGTGPTAGTLYVTYTTPNSDDGALLVKVIGPAVTSVAIDTSLKGYSRISTNGDTAMIVVAGTVHSGIVARLSVPDTRAFASYGASVLQVAQASTYAQRGLSGYSVAVSQ
jgi:hypothetical protein